MGKNYDRLNLFERIEIEKHLSHNLSYSEIARLINRSKSTIQREVIKQGRNKYEAMKGTWIHTSNQSNRRFGKSKIKLNTELENYVMDKLAKRWSPEQISTKLKLCYPLDPSMQLSHESIYMYIYVHAKPELRKELVEQLRQKRKYRGNVRRGADKRTTIKDPISIDERPEEVKGRLIPGHWEGDLIIGKEHASAIGTLVERTTRTIILVPLKKRDATSVRKAFVKEFKNIPSQMKLSMTYDNGTEMAEHKLFTKQTKISVYFAHPYSPWERPTNENSNGLVRDYFPKGTDFNTISKARLKAVQDELNERPRKVLNWQSPKEVFEEIILNQIN